MLVRCCVCETFLEEKEPYSDFSISHTYCPLCLEEEMRNIEILRQQIEIEKTHAANL